MKIVLCSSGGFTGLTSRVTVDIEKGTLRSEFGLLPRVEKERALEPWELEEASNLAEQFMKTLMQPSYLSRNPVGDDIVQHISVSVGSETKATYIEFDSDTASPRIVSRLIEKLLSFRV